MDYEDLSKMMLFSATLSVKKAVLMADGEVAAAKLAMHRRALKDSGVSLEELQQAREDIGLSKPATSTNGALAPTS